MALNNTIENKQDYIDDPLIPADGKVPSAQINEFVTYQKLQGVNQGTFNPANIVIEGSGTFDNYTHSTATLTLTAGASVTTSGDNYVKLKITFDVDCAVSFAGEFDNDQLFGLPTGNVFTAGTYLFVFFHDPVNSKIGFVRPGTVGSAPTPTLTTPTLVLSVGDGQLGYTISNEDAAATDGVFTYDTNSDFSTEIPVPGYAFATKTGNITGLVNGTTYYARILNTAAGYNNSGYGSDSAAPESGIVQLPQITGLVATSGQDGEVPLTWDAPSGNADNLSVERSLSSGSGFSVINTPLANATAYTDNTAVNGTTYFYRVREIGDGITYSDGPYSTEASATPNVGGIGTPITFQDVSANASASGNNILKTGAASAWDAGGRSSEEPAGDFEFIFQIDASAVSPRFIAGTSDVAKTAVDFSQIVWGVFVTDSSPFGRIINAMENGAVSTSYTIDLAEDEYIKIKGVNRGTTPIITLERSTDGTIWTTVHTYSNSNANNMHFDCSLNLQNTEISNVVYNDL